MRTTLHNYVMQLPQAVACIRQSFLKLTFGGKEEDVGMGVVELCPHKQGMTVHNMHYSYPCTRAVAGQMHK